MKKLFYFIGIFLSLSLISVASAMSTSTSSGYNAPIFVDYLNFQAELQDDGSLKMTWNPDTEKLKYYKVSRSQSNESPVYPEDGYIYAGKGTTYTDKNPPAGKTYYRVCAIRTDNDRICSNVVILEAEESDICIQVITYAKKGDQCKQYPTPCAVPDGWTKVDACASEPTGDLELTIELKDDKPYLQWYLSEGGAAPNGYKIAISTQNEKPTYPVMSGDTYQYLSHESAKTYHHKNVSSGKTYHYRVCLYEGGKCGNYSNAISIKVPGESNNEKEEEKEEEKEAFGKLELNVELKDGKPYLKWNFEDDGAAPKGYKIAISKTNNNPTYPVMSGDSYKYLSHENAKSYHHKNASSGKTYNYRICLYIGGQCESYSNAVKITAGESTKTAEKNEGETSKKTVTPKKKFSDVKSGIWFESYLNDFVNRGIIEGYQDGSFQPSRTVNRAEMAKMVVKALGVNVEDNDLEIFCDVAADAWYKPYVLQLYFDNVIEGYTGGDCAAGRTFRASQEVSRAEGIKIILAMFGASVEPLSSGDQTGFTDVDSSHWAAAYIRTAFSRGIVNGYDDGTFQPNTPLTRAEFVKMLSEAEEVLK